MRKTVTSVVSFCVFAFSHGALGDNSTPGKIIVSQAAVAAPVPQKAAFIPQQIPLGTAAPFAPSEELGAIVFSAPPRESFQVGKDTYEPIAEYLTKALGKKVVYSHPGTWGVYRTKMVQGSYDLVFDGPHFNSYRADKLSHNILVKIPGSRDFAIIVKKGANFDSVLRLAGRTFCTHAPPNLGTLILFSQFTNPARQPVIINTKGWKSIYDGVMSGQCVAGILPGANLRKYDTAGSAKILFRSPAMPDQAFSAGPRLSPEEQTKIAQVLVSPDGARATEKLRTRFRGGNSLAVANNNEYKGIAEFLKDEWGYY